MLEMLTFILLELNFRHGIYFLVIIIHYSLFTKIRNIFMKKDNNLANSADRIEKCRSAIQKFKRIFSLSISGTHFTIGRKLKS